ncbi:hypothetical protein [Clostridium cellulovorans]|uniref:Uncharacterized protein n=1 Tax=Clostridium cellulovorans (strain ATCC 35296 / DSM 3052 / OCM 3 / 743B) TaxID=573061 RepID=D9SLN8_CLOC7|nr:hypothetical protein [Clostridium cellulovorans]ADL53675.1 hypothetical protein Clocel_4012 [Clostridium cellulovorans 743B]
MSQQMTDPFDWNKKEYIFIAASDVYELFDPEKFGLKPEAPHTACWKGFIIHFSVKQSQLFIDKLEVNCEDDVYPSINGVEAVDKSRWGDFHVYNKLKMPVTYTGTIIIGKHLNKSFLGRAFTGPHSYDETYELEFEQGILIGSKETSGTYQGI